jgi:hypothetical protein
MNSGWCLVPQEVGGARALDSENLFFFCAHKIVPDTVPPRKLKETVPVALRVLSHLKIQHESKFSRQKNKKIKERLF